MATIAQLEFTRLVAHGRFRAVHIAGLALVGLGLVDGWLLGQNVLGHGLALVLLLSMTWQVIRYPRSTVGEWARTVATGLYIGATASHLIRLRALPEDGRSWTVLVVAVTLLADSAAYAVGSLCGNHQLAPRLSPGKTVEGHLAGILLGGLTGTILGWLAGHSTGSTTALTTARGLWIGLLVAGLAPLGDLTISMAKREAGVKDSGHLLPGHGGMLDRLDSVLFAAVISYSYLVWFVY